MQIEQRGAVTSIWFDVWPGWEQWLFMTSDNHWDSIYCNREFLTEDLEKVKQRKALAFVFGDFYDAMQGRFDPRRSNYELREEFRREDYYDVVVDQAGDYLDPYAANIAMMCKGNHEKSVLKNANTDLIDRLVGRLNRENGTVIQRGGFGGWVRLMFNMSGGENTGPRTSIKIKFFHGAGGEAPVTRGAIQTNRQAVYLPDANIVVNGHSHNAYYIPITRERLSNKGEQFFDTQHHLRIPGYKQGYADGTGGWEAERGGVPKPLGSWWVRLYCENGQIKVQPAQEFHDPVPVSPAPPDPRRKEDAVVFAQDGEYP